jgi:septation ring formation regulator EzrA
MLILTLKDIVGLIALGLFLIVVLMYGVGYLFRSIKMKINRLFNKKEKK